MRTINKRGVRPNNHKYTIKTLGTCNPQRPATQKGLRHLLPEGIQARRAVCQGCPNHQPRKLKDPWELLAIEEDYPRSAMDTRAAWIVLREHPYRLHQCMNHAQSKTRLNRRQARRMWQAFIGSYMQQWPPHYLGGNRRRMLPYSIEHHMNTQLV